MNDNTSGTQVVDPAGQSGQPLNDQVNASPPMSVPVASQDPDPVINNASANPVPTGQANELPWQSRTSNQVEPLTYPDDAQNIPVENQDTVMPTGINNVTNTLENNNSIVDPATTGNTINSPLSEPVNTSPISQNVQQAYIPPVIEGDLVTGQTQIDPSKGITTNAGIVEQSNTIEPTINNNNLVQDNDLPELKFTPSTNEIPITKADSFSEKIEQTKELDQSEVDPNFPQFIDNTKKSDDTVVPETLPVGETTIDEEISVPVSVNVSALPVDNAKIDSGEMSSSNMDLPIANAGNVQNKIDENTDQKAVEGKHRIKSILLLIAVLVLGILALLLGIFFAVNGSI